METKPPYKTLKFWATAVLTMLGLTMASGVINVDESNVDEAIGWIVTMAAALGFQGWKPAVEAIKQDDTTGN